MQLETGINININILTHIIKSHVNMLHSYLIVVKMIIHTHHKMILGLREIRIVLGYKSFGLTLIPGFLGEALLLRYGRIKRILRNV